MTLRCLIGMACICFLLLCGCREQTQSPQTPSGNDASAQAKKSKLSQTSMKTQLGLIAVGDTREDVISVLGSPTHKHAMTAKERPVTVGVVMYYVVEQADPRDLNAKSDRYVAIYFDDAGKVREILRNNIE